MQAPVRNPLALSSPTSSHHTSRGSTINERGYDQYSKTTAYSSSSIHDTNNIHGSNIKEGEKQSNATDYLLVAFLMVLGVAVIFGIFQSFPHSYNQYTFELFNAIPLSSSAASSTAAQEGFYFVYWKDSPNQPESVCGDQNDDSQGDHCPSCSLFGCNSVQTDPIAYRTSTTGAIYLDAWFFNTLHVNLYSLSDNQLIESYSLVISTQYSKTFFTSLEHTESAFGVYLDSQTQKPQMLKLINNNLDADLFLTNLEGGHSKVSLLFTETIGVVSQDSSLYMNLSYSESVAWTRPVHLETSSELTVFTPAISQPSAELTLETAKGNSKEFMTGNFKARTGSGRSIFNLIIGDGSSASPHQIWQLPEELWAVPTFQPTNTPTAPTSVPTQFPTNELVADFLSPKAFAIISVSAIFLYLIYFFRRCFCTVAHEDKTGWKNHIQRIFSHEAFDASQLDLTFHHWDEKEPRSKEKSKEGREGDEESGHGEKREEVEGEEGEEGEEEDKFSDEDFMTVCLCLPGKMIRHLSKYYCFFHYCCLPEWYIREGHPYIDKYEKHYRIDCCSSWDNCVFEEDTHSDAMKAHEFAGSIAQLNESEYVCGCIPRESFHWFASRYQILHCLLPPDAYLPPEDSRTLKHKANHKINCCKGKGVIRWCTTGSYRIFQDTLTLIRKFFTCHCFDALTEEELAAEEERRLEDLESRSRSSSYGTLSRDISRSETPLMDSTERDDVSNKASEISDRFEVLAQRQRDRDEEKAKEKETEREREMERQNEKKKEREREAEREREREKQREREKEIERQREKEIERQRENERLAQQQQQISVDNDDSSVVSYATGDSYTAASAETAQTSDREMMKGWLMKQGVLPTSWLKRYIAFEISDIINEGYLRVYDDVSMKVKKEELFLSQAATVVAELPSTKNASFIFKVEVSSSANSTLPSKSSITLKASTQEEMEAWMIAIGTFKYQPLPESSATAPGGASNAATTQRRLSYTTEGSAEKDSSLPLSRRASYTPTGNATSSDGSLGAQQPANAASSTPPVASSARARFAELKSKYGVSASTPAGSANTPSNIDNVNNISDKDTSPTDSSSSKL